jgi:regulatory protein
MARRPFPSGSGRRRGSAHDAPPVDDGSAGDGRGDADPEQVARQICLHQLEHAPRTRAELAATLTKRGVTDDVADQVLTRFTDVGLIDDAALAQQWVSSRHRSRGLAGRALTQELRRKGVDDDVVREAVDGLDDEQQEATARALVERKLRATRGLPTDARVRRLAGMLARKGYASGLSFRVVKQALADEGEQIALDTDGLSALD